MRSVKIIAACFFMLIQSNSAFANWPNIAVPGDENQDFEFNSSDLVIMYQTGAATENLVQLMTFGHYEKTFNQFLSQLTADMVMYSKKGDETKFRFRDHDWTKEKVKRSYNEDGELIGIEEVYEGSLSVDLIGVERDEDIKVKLHVKKEIEDDEEVGISITILEELPRRVRVTEYSHFSEEECARDGGWVKTDDGYLRNLSYQNSICVQDGLSQVIEERDLDYLEFMYNKTHNLLNELNEASNQE